MFRTLRYMAVAVVAVFALAVPSFAAQAKPAAKAPKAAAAKTMTVSGTLEKVEGQDLTVKTAKGSEEVMFGNDVKIRRAGKALTTSDLTSATGSRVTVRYKEDNGHKMASSVTLSAAKAAAAPKKAPASASAKPVAPAAGTKK